MKFFEEENLTRPKFINSIVDWAEPVFIVFYSGGEGALFNFLESKGSEFLKLVGYTIGYWSKGNGNESDKYLQLILDKYSAKKTI